MATVCWRHGCAEAIRTAENEPQQFVVPVHGVDGQVRFFAMVASCQEHVPDPAQPGYWEGVSMARRLAEYSDEA